MIEDSLFKAVSALELLCIIAVIFFERKNSASTIAWILVLVFLPFIGFVAYAMFGSGFHINKKKRYAVKLVSDTLYKDIITKHLDRHSTPDGNPQCTDCGRLIRYLESEGRYLYTRDNSAHIFTDGKAMFDRMKDDMRKAEKHIHLLYYMFRNDALGREITAILTEKAQSGVIVRVMYDSLGSMLGFDRLFDGLRAAGGQVEAFSPILQRFNPRLRLNYRNHCKITVIDGLVGYVGGMNIGDEYVGKHKKLHPWRDTHLRLTGSSVNFLQERFLMDWIYASETDIELDQVNIGEFFPPPLVEDDTGIQIVSSGPDTATSPIKNGLLEMLHSARRTIFIQTPYFTPDDSFLDALRIAAKSGVDVRLMLPGLSDNPIVHPATLSYAWQVLDAGVRVYVYPGFLHAKTMTFDGQAMSIGTTNIGTRSFTLNFEVNAFIYAPDLAGSHEGLFLADQALCTELTKAWFSSRKPLTRAAFGLSRLIAPLI